MDDETIRIAVALRLRLPICTPHTFRQRGIRVDTYAHHGLSIVGNTNVMKQLTMFCTEQWHQQA